MKEKRIKEKRDFLEVIEGVGIGIGIATGAIMILLIICFVFAAALNSF